MCSFSAINLNSSRNKHGSSFSVLVDVFLESLVSNIHLAKTCEYLVCASIIIGGDVRLKLGDKRLCLGKINTCTDEILSGLGKMYVADERFKKNIDKYGEGTAEFAAAAIAVYTKKI